jgi:hypothetical protein
VTETDPESGNDEAGSTAFGYRSPRRFTVRNAPWFAGALTLVLAGVLVAADFPVAYFAVLTVGIVVSVALLWTRQMTGTDLRVADGQITWTSAGGSRTVTVADDPVVAIGASAWRGRQLRFRSGTALPMATGGDDWPTFVSALERAQGSRIDQSGVTSRRSP